MPEVVEVHLTALYLSSALVGKEFMDISILGGRYSRHPMVGLEEFTKLLKTERFKVAKVDSKGKFLYMVLKSKDRKVYILNRFGLEGSWGTKQQKHSGVVFVVGGDYYYFTDSRNFGTIQIAFKKEELISELDKLAPDFLKTPFTRDEFYQRVMDLDKKGKLEIIKVLMEQNKGKSLGSGLGNYLGVEILYHAKISPFTKLSKIQKDRGLSDTLCDSIKYITKLAFLTSYVGYLDDSSKLDGGMAEFIRKSRDGVWKDHYHPDVSIGNRKFHFKVYRQDKDPKGNPVVGDKIVTGRTTYWVPNVQK